MVGFVIVVAVISGLLHGQLLDAFKSNPMLNGLIVLLLLFGIVYAFRQVLMLSPEVAWIETFQAADNRLSLAEAPVLLGPMATMIGETHGRMSLSTMSLSSLLDSISSRLDETRETSRYLIGLLIFLGLLGTFWGLLETVASVGGTIAGLSVAGGDFATVFSDLKTGLESPLAGMAIAFSSSLFGLASSLILGFLELQAGQAQNRFYNELEDWLSNHTRLSGGGGMVEGDHSVPVYIQALLEQTADGLENLQRIISRNEEGRVASQNAMLSLAEKLASLSDHMKSERSVMQELAESQGELRYAVQRLVANTENTKSGGGMDEASRNHLRNLDVYVTRLLEEISEGRNQTVSELRSEIKLLARTIAAAADNRPRQPLPGPER